MLNIEHTSFSGTEAKQAELEAQHPRAVVYVHARPIDELRVARENAAAGGRGPAAGAEPPPRGGRPPPGGGANKR